jgi:hypothetical protein
MVIDLTVESITLGSRLSQKYYRVKIKTNTGAFELLRSNFERSKETVSVVRIIETLLGDCEELIRAVDPPGIPDS